MIFNLFQAIYSEYWVSRVNSKVFWVEFRCDVQKTRKLQKRISVLIRTSG